MEFCQNKFHEIDLFDFTSFLARIFLNFLAHCASMKNQAYIYDYNNSSLIKEKMTFYDMDGYAE